VNEAQLSGWTRGLISGAGLLAHHAVSRCPGCHLILPAGDAGFPDLAIAGPRGVLLRELKTRAGILSPAQRRWARALGGLALPPPLAGYPVPAAAGIPLYDVWRDPVDRASGRIGHELAAIA
jgi:hypothetical protein